MYILKSKDLKYVLPSDPTLIAALDWIREIDPVRFEAIQRATRALTKGYTGRRHKRRPFVFI